MNESISSSRVKVPAPVLRAFAGAEPPCCPEQKLYRAVIVRAVFDALGHTGEKKRKNHVKCVSGARAWLKFGENRDFIFAMADLDPAAICPPVLKVKRIH